jgi:6-phosphogluconolactonase
VKGTVRLVDSVPDAFCSVVAGALAQATAPASLFLSGGGTAEACYRRLATTPGIDWPSVDVYLGDERCVPPDDADSNHRMIVETLLSAVGPVHGDHPMDASGDPAEAAQAYQELVAPLDGFDVVHLGLGPDGHTASLFPDSEALAVDDPDVLVVANVDPRGTNPHPRLTLTYPGIARGRLVVLTVAGASKHDALARILADEDLPAGRVEGGDVLWLVDAEAVGDLELPAVH